MRRKVLSLLARYRELLSYAFWGVGTTVINYGCYQLFNKVFGIHYLIANTIAWVLSVLFAFATNKAFVFHSKSWAWRVVLRELWQMVAARLFTLGLETAILWVFVDMLRYNDSIVKLLANVVVILVNYVLSKFIIFKKKPN